MHRYIAFSLLFAFSLACGLGGPKVVMEPFGFPLGGVVSPEMLEEHECEEMEDDSGILMCKSAPKDLGNVEVYLLVRVEDGRVAKVIAMTEPESGVDLRVGFGEMRALLVEKYGEPSREVDLVDEGSLWTSDEPVHFAMGLMKDERTLTSFWDVEEVVSIGLRGDSRNGLSTFLRISYEHDELLGLAQQEIEAAKAPDGDAL